MKQALPSIKIMLHRRFTSSILAIFLLITEEPDYQLELENALILEDDELETGTDVEVTLRNDSDEDIEFGS